MIFCPWPTRDISGRFLTGLHRQLHRSRIFWSSALSTNGISCKSVFFHYRCSKTDSIHGSQHVTSVALRCSDSGKSESRLALRKILNYWMTFHKLANKHNCPLMSSQYYILCLLIVFHSLSPCTLKTTVFVSLY